MEIVALEREDEGIVTLAEGVRLWFIVIWSLSIVGSLAAFIQFRSRRAAVEKQVGPLPTPMGILQIVVLPILLTRIGEISASSSAGWLIVRVLGIGLSLYSLGMLLWVGRTLGRFGAPGPAVFRDHELITSGPYRLVRHPGYSAIQAIVLGAALGTLNWLILALWPVAVIATYLNSRAEERLLREKFGTAYEEYAQQKNRFIPIAG
jgi:protein-S-isoprenylcysteine O-methyltransferase Ste14